MKLIHKALALLAFIFATFAVFAQIPEQHDGAVRTADLKLLPEPKHVTRFDGAVTLTPTSRIVVRAPHAKADRVAAEMLAEEIESETGKQAPIQTGVGPARNTIYLTRISDDRTMRKLLPKNGLAIEKEHDAESYLLLARNGQIVVAGAGDAGLFYGVQTLRQLLRMSGGKLICPEVAIKDWPTMKIRGVHDDISRGPVPTLDYMKKQVRTLAEYKINMLGLYIEHTFDYQTHPLIAPKEGALNAAQVKELVAYAQRYHVTLLPEQQAFGHLHHVLKNEMYQDVSEMPYGHVLTPTKPQSYQLIQDLYGELIPLFPGPYFHIGADETWELGRGQTKARADEIGLGNVYIDHLAKVAEIVKPYNKRLMFWGDIAVKYPDALKVLPKDVIAVPWSYGARESFEKDIKPFKDAGLDIVVAPGANNWNRIWPNLDVAYVNIRNFVRDGKKFGALGMLNTTWDDDGEALFGMTWPALVFGADCAWQAGECSVEQFEAKYDWAFYRNPGAEFTTAIRDLNHTHALLKSVKLGDANDAGFWADPFSKTGAAYVRTAMPVAPEIRRSAERALAGVYRSSAKAKLHADTLAYLTLTAQRLDLLGMKIEFTAELNRLYWDAYQNSTDRRRVWNNFGQMTGINAMLQDLRDATTRQRALYSELWLKENRPYWLGNVTIKYDNLAAEYARKIQEIEGARAQFGMEGKLDAPETMGFFLNPNPPAAPATPTNGK